MESCNDWRADFSVTLKSNSSTDNTLRGTCKSCNQFGQQIKTDGFNGFRVRNCKVNTRIKNMFFNYSQLKSYNSWNIWCIPIELKSCLNYHLINDLHCMPRVKSFMEFYIITRRLIVLLMNYIYFCQIISLNDVIFREKKRVICETSDCVKKQM